MVGKFWLDGPFFLLSIYCQHPIEGGEEKLEAVNVEGFEGLIGDLRSLGSEAREKASSLDMRKKRQDKTRQDNQGKFRRPSLESPAPAC